MKQKILLIIGGVVLLASAVAVGRFTTPTKTVEKEKIVYQDKIITKIVYQKDTSHRKNKVTIKFVKILPDGTKTIETKTYDSSEIEILEKNNLDQTKDTKTVIDKEKLVEFQKGDWMFSFGVKSDLGFNPAYGVFINRRILGPFYLGAFGFTDQTFGASAGIIF